MISGMRGLGLPAAYVSGYLRTVQKPDEERLAGADAMHAWVLVWCGEACGWRGLDPTNAIFAGNDYVVLAVGRDYADVAPIDGVIFVGRRPASEGRGERETNREQRIARRQQRVANGE